MTKHTFRPGEKEAVAQVLGIEAQMLPDTLELENDLDEDEDEDENDESEIEELDEDEDEDETDDSDIDEDSIDEEDDEDDEEDIEAEEQDLGIRVQAATDDWLANHKDSMSLADYLKTKGF